MSEERFALIREPEADALRSLSCNAAKAFIAIKFGRRDGDKIAFGVRDLETWGLSRSVAARALAELVGAGLLAIESNSTFGRKRQRRVYRVVHTREAPAPQSRQRDKGTRNSPSGGTIGGATVPQAGQTEAIQSRQRDTSQETSSTSSRKSKEEEVSAEQREGRASLREQLLRIDRAADAVAMTGTAFMQKAGGPKPADFLARKFERGDLTAMQLRAALADPPNGSARESEGRTPARDRTGAREVMAGAA